jgi:DNA-directed RNA polymerase subunit RPC12/RpoP
VAYLFIALGFGLAGGVVARVRGGSWLAAGVWFLVSAIVPFVGLLCAALYRTDAEELCRRCPNCGKVVQLHDALCTRCGTELEYPDDPDEILPSEATVYRQQHAR